MMPYTKTAADFSSAERDSCIEGVSRRGFGARAGKGIGDRARGWARGSV